jgi:hypothetical protein
MSIPRRCPEKRIILDDACRTADVVKRLQDIVDAADDLRVRGSQGQPVAMPEVAELRHYRALLTTLLRALTLPDEDDGLTRSQIGKLGAQARWGNRGETETAKQAPRQRPCGS